MKSRFVLLLVVLLVTGFSARPVLGCPFCSAVSQTFGEEISTMDVVVMARLIEAPGQPDADASDPNAELSKSKFEVVQVIKGKQWLGDAGVVETLYFGPAKIGETFLIMGADPPDVMWSTPLLLSQRAQEYVVSLVNLPQNGQRLRHFINYLEDEDEMLARDAYDEFAKASYADVKAVVEIMDRGQLIAWIKDADVPVSRRRLYMTMLGVCGTVEDTPLLEEMIGSDDRADKAGLDALIACYLMLKGPDGMPLVEELFLKNDKAEYADTYSAIMALRFHGTEANVIPRERLLEGLRYMLDRPQLADLVIPDLARWEDWSVMERLVQLFKEADEESSWVRVPVVNYLRACPLPEASEYIKVVQEVDPDAVKRANTFFPFASPTTVASATDSTKAQPAGPASSDDSNVAQNDTAAEENTAVGNVVDEKPSGDVAKKPNIASAPDTSAGNDGPVKAASLSPSSESNAEPSSSDASAAIEAEDEQGASAGELAQASPAGDATSDSNDSPGTSPVAAASDVGVVLLLGVPLAGGILLLLLLWMILRGTGSSVKS